MRKKTKTVPFCYRLRSKKLCFRLPINSPSQFLWNYYLAKKVKVKLTMMEIARLAREQTNDNHHNETFILNMVYQHQQNVQKAHDRIFELALERYHQLKGLGQVPVLRPPEVPSPRIEEVVTKGEKPEKKPDIAPQMPQTLDKIYLDFPPSLRDLLTFEYDEPSKRIKISSKGKQWIGEPVLTEVRNIVEKHQGRWVRGEHWTQSFWVIPLG